MNALLDGSAIAVTDGSYYRNVGTAAWTIQGKSATGCWHGPVTTPGTAELSGILATIVVVDLIVEHYGLQFGSITVGCDNLLAVQKASGAATQTSQAKPT